MTDIAGVEDTDSVAGSDFTERAELLAAPIEFGLNSTTRIAIIGLFVFALLYSMYAAQIILVPFFSALFLSFVFAPIVRTFAQFYLPTPIAAALIVVAFVASSMFGLYYLSTPAEKWLDEFPTIADQIRSKVIEFKEPVTAVVEAGEQVEELTELKSEPVTKVQLQEPSLTERFAWNLPILISQTVFTVVLLYFLLAGSDGTKAKIIKVIPRMENRKRAFRILSQMERDVSIYLSTFALINAGLGVAVGLTMYALSLPNPILWGTMAAILNFVPYVGALVGVAIVSVASLIQFDGLAQIAMPPLAYLFLTVFEGQVITPSIMGRRLTLNPLVIFLFVAFWAWLWGPVGALFAVPMLILIKVFGEHVGQLRGLHALLSP